MASLNLPIGNENFKDIRNSGKYYIDKTGLISQLLKEKNSEVTLFTRPRRFGKSLNMNMLSCFFDIRQENSKLFEGLEISENKEICDEWLNKYPTIYVSMKDVYGLNYEQAMGQLKSCAASLYQSSLYLLNSDKFDEVTKNRFNAVYAKTSSEIDIMESLLFLTKLMSEYYNKQVVLLIDEYDVPMAKGHANGYYREIANVMRTVYSKALKGNPYLKIAVLAGCLRIVKESIFTGLNNLYVNSISNEKFDEYFGFTDSEMDKLLADADLTDHKDEIKDWYDGYLFGNKEVYCPWDVLSYLFELQDMPNTPPMNYWANTSSNEIIRAFLDSGIDVSDEFEVLMKGKCIKKKINENITYEELTESEENFWSMLYMTGYLTVIRDTPEELEERRRVGRYELEYKLRIPNKELKILFKDTIYSWFNAQVTKDDRTELFKALLNANDEALSKIVSGYLYDTISYYDYAENYYHAFLAGLLSGVKGCKVFSNKELGAGRPDIVFRDKPHKQISIFEIKRTYNKKELPELCDEALRQIDEMEYAKPYEDYDLEIVKYGVAFFKKRCLIKKAK